MFGFMSGIVGTGSGKRLSLLPKLKPVVAVVCSSY